MLTRPKIEMAEAMFEYTPQHVGDLALIVGDKIEVSRKGDDGWWTGTLRGKRGNFPGELLVGFSALFSVTICCLLRKLPTKLNITALFPVTNYNCVRYNLLFDVLEGLRVHLSFSRLRGNLGNFPNE